MFKGRKKHVQKHAINQVMLFATLPSLKRTEVWGLLSVRLY